MTTSPPSAPSVQSACSLLWSYLLRTIFACNYSRLCLPALSYSPEFCADRDPFQITLSWLSPHFFLLNVTNIFEPHGTVLKPNVFSQRSLFPSKFTSLQNVLCRKLEKKKNQWNCISLHPPAQRCLLLKVYQFLNQVTPQDDKTQLPFLKLMFTLYG